MAFIQKGVIDLQRRLINKTICVKNLQNSLFFLLRRTKPGVDPTADAPLAGHLPPDPASGRNWPGELLTQHRPVGRSPLWPEIRLSSSVRLFLGIEGHLEDLGNFFLSSNDQFCLPELMLQLLGCLLQLGNPAERGIEFLFLRPPLFRGKRL